MTMDEFCERCSANLEGQVKGFDFMILLPLIIDLVLETLSGCGRDDDEVVQMIRTNNFYARWACRSAVRKVNQQERKRMPIGQTSELILGTAAAEDEADIKTLLSEVHNNVPHTDYGWG